MKSIRVVSGPVLILLVLHIAAFGYKPTAGFYLPDSVDEMTLKYRTVTDLIVLPVVINDSVRVNLILDTGCRNLILFGKKFRKLLSLSPSRPIEFSGLGRGRPLSGNLSLGNRVSINHVLGEQIPVVIVGTNNLFASYHNIHGVIGYEIFLKFEIELNARARTISFRPALKSSVPCGYTQVALSVVDARPVMRSEIFTGKQAPRALELMIDTGSSLGLLLKTTNISEYGLKNEKILGVGLNGPVSGYEMISDKLKIDGLEIRGVSTGIVSSEWHNNGSIGMDILKDYVVIINYCKSYVCFKRNAAASSGSGVTS